MISKHIGCYVIGKYLEKIVSIFTNILHIRKCNLIEWIYLFINNIDSLKFMSNQLLSPEAPKIARSDSLVFSITAEKDESPHDTDLLRDSYEQDPSREIDNLHNKLEVL